MINNVIIYGPAGCGKTHNAEALRKHYGMDRVVDEFALSGERTVALSGNLILMEGAGAPPLGHFGRVVSFEKALKEAGLAC